MVTTAVISRLKTRSALLKIAFIATILDMSILSSASSADVLLLMPYHKNLLENGSLEGYVGSEKLDGIRAVWDGKTLKTRAGNVINAPKCWLRGFPSFRLDGELWIRRGEYEKTLSVVSKQNGKCEEWGEVFYYVFDVQDCGEWLEKQKTLPTCTLTQRLEVLERFLDTLKKDSSPNTKEILINKTSTTEISKSQTSQKHSNLDSSVLSPIRIITQIPLHSKKQLESMLNDIVKNGGEGMVIRKNSAQYEIGRSKNALKLKPYFDAECRVVAHNAGKGRLSGKMGSILCEGEDKNGSIIRFKIGTGFSDKERENPPAIDSVITYKYYGFTRHNLPRFPVFFREYKEQ